MGHPIHKAVARAIGEVVDEQSVLHRDHACDDRTEECVKQQIPLFLGPKGLRTQLCKVDLVVIQSGKVKVIVEIEESGFKPTIVCGKFLTSALTTHYRHKSLDVGEAPLEQVLFIQVMKCENKSGRSAKPDQYKVIEEAIQRCFPLQGSQLVEYKLFCVKDKDDPIIREIADSVKEKLMAAPQPAQLPARPQ